MDFQKAEQLKRKNSHLIGKRDNGQTIDELILVPSNPDLAVDFFKLYRQTLDGEKSILPFTGTDVDIVAVFNKKYFEQSFFFHKNILDLPDGLEVITE